MTQPILTRSQKEKRNYALVRNITGDPKLARQARSWSDARIKDVYGLKRVPKTVTLIDIKTIRKARTIGRDIAYDTVKIPDLSDRITPARTREARRDEWRVWAEGDGKESKFPIRIRNLVKQINKRQINPIKESQLPASKRALPFDEYAGYGFAVVWYAYVETGSLDEATLLFYEAQSIPDRHDGEMYTAPTKII